MKKILIKKSINADDSLDNSVEQGINGQNGTDVTVINKKKKLQTLRAAAVCLIIFTLLCGVIYPMTVMLIGQTAFPYEANGSQIIVTLPDGSQRVYGSELIGQSYEDARYLFGRVNGGAPTNMSPESDEFKKLIEERVAERKAKLLAIGHVEDGNIPDELLTSSGSGVDPHISPKTAYFQVDAIVAGRNATLKEGETAVTAADVEAVIKKYTDGRWLGVFGEKRVNVLLVNLALDGLI